MVVSSVANRIIESADMIANDMKLENYQEADFVKRSITRPGMFVPIGGVNRIVVSVDPRVFEKVCDVIGSESMAWELFHYHTERFARQLREGTHTLYIRRVLGGKPQILVYLKYLGKNKKRTPDEPSIIIKMNPQKRIATKN